MTVNQLKEQLAAYPDDMEVFLCAGKTEFEYGLLNSVRKENIRFHQIPEDEDVEAFEDCVVLDEE